MDQRLRKFLHNLHLKRGKIPTTVIEITILYTTCFILYLYIEIKELYFIPFGDSTQITHKKPRYVKKKSIIIPMRETTLHSGTSLNSVHS
eukprot:c22019_g2_i1 orf=236-505(-)